MYSLSPNKPAVLMVHNLTTRLLPIKSALSEFARVHAVKSKRSALSALQSVDDISLIMLDLETPAMCAYEFLDFLESSQDYGRIPVIAVTLNPQDAIQKTLSKYDNVTGVIGKPSSIEEIREMAAEILGAHTAQTEKGGEQ